MINNYPLGAHTSGSPPNTLYVKSPNGYMNSELYLLWFQHIFFKKKYASSKKPLVLIQDGHTSHVTLELIDEAKKNQVEIVSSLPMWCKVLYGPFKQSTRLPSQPFLMQTKIL